MLPRFLISMMIGFILIPASMSVVSANKYATLELPRVYIQPGTIYYPVIRAWEKFIYNFNLTKQSKIDFNRNLLKNRLAELKKVVEDKKLGEVESSSQRVSYYAGVLTDLVLQGQEKDDQEGKATQVKSDIVNDFNSYIELLNELRDEYPANSSFWMLVQHSINSLDTNIVRLENETR